MIISMLYAIIRWCSCCFKIVFATWMPQIKRYYYVAVHRYNRGTASKKQRKLLTLLPSLTLGRHGCER